MKQQINYERGKIIMKTLKTKITTIAVRAKNAITNKRAEGFVDSRITSYNVCYTKLLRCFIINEVNMNIPLVAHNADFDAKFLIYYLQKYGFSIDLEFCDTLHLSRKLHPEFENHKLATVISNYNITNDNAHRATFDAEACGKVFIAQMNEIKSKYSSQITNLDSFAFEIV